MFEMFVLMMAVAIRSVPSSESLPEAMSSSAAIAVPAVPVETAGKPVEQPVGPATDAAPAFLAPTPAPATEAPPVFLAAPAPALVAEPQLPTGRFTTATEVKPILDITRGNWIAVREFDGQDLLYVTHLWSWRCGLVELRIGINGAPPEIWPLPPCHPDQQAPNAILEGDGLPYRAYALGSIAMVEVHLTYDDLSTDSGRYNRQGLPIP